MTNFTSPCIVTTPSLPVDTIVAPPIDLAVTRAEYNLLRRLRQIRRARFAAEIILNVQTMTLRLVSVDTEILDTEGQ